MNIVDPKEVNETLNIIEKPDTTRIIFKETGNK